MKIYGIKLDYDRPFPGPGLIRLLRLNSSATVLLELDHFEAMHFDGWKDLTINGEPLEFDPDQDVWAAPSFVKTVHLRTRPDANDCVQARPVAYD